MGVDIRFITMYGVSLNEEDHDALYDYIDGNNIKTINFEFTDPDSKEMILGNTILKTDSMRWDTPWGYEATTFEMCEYMKTLYIQDFMKTLPEEFWPLVHRDWRLYTFVQYR